jgi:hypothetical protein
MKTYTFPVKPHQIKIIEEIKNLPLKRLHYLVVQQSLRHPNLTLNELKKHIRRGIKRYVKELMGYRYRYGIEDELIKYYCFFETSKDFFWSQQLNDIVNENIEMNIHFHLFLSGDYPDVNFTQLIQYILRELTSQKNKTMCLGKVDYVRLETLENDFILYHTKQMMYRPTPQFIMKNL